MCYINFKQQQQKYTHIRVLSQERKEKRENIRFFILLKNIERFFQTSALS